MRSCIYYLGGAKHVFAPIAELDGTMIDHYKKLLKRADEKLTEMHKLEKETWNSLDQDDVHRRQLIEDAERDREEKVVFLLFLQMCESHCGLYSIFTANLQST